MARLPVATIGASQVTVGDVADVRDAAQIQYNSVRVDGQPSVYLPVLKQGGDSNTISVVVDNYVQKNGLDYTVIEEVRGALSGCLGEWDRRIAWPYEDEKIIEGGQNEFVRRVPGRMTWPNLVLKRGVTSSDALFNWFRQSSGEGFSGQQNRLTRRTGHLTLLGGLSGNRRERIREWAFYEAFPVKWSGPTFAASGKDVATETLEIAHHGFRVS